MIAVAFVAMQALLLLNFALFRAEVEHVTFLEETYTLHAWKKYQANLNEIFTDGEWVEAWDRVDYKSIYSYPCRWSNSWFDKFTGRNYVDPAHASIVCFNSMPNQGYAWLWKPKREELAMWSSRKFCEIVRGHNVMIVGDSLQEELYFTTLSALRSRTIITSKTVDIEAKRLSNRRDCMDFCIGEENSQHLCTAPQSIDCGEDLPSFQLSFYRYNKIMLYAEPEDTHEEGKDGGKDGGKDEKAKPSDRFDDDHIDSSNTDKHTHKPQLLYAPWIEYLWQNNITVLILSHGPHFHPEETESIRDITYTVLEYLTLNYPNISVIWRSSAYGHPDSDNKFKSNPLTKAPDIDENSIYTQKFNWGNFGHMNDIVENVINTFYPHVLYMDIFNSTVLRADSHADELHYCLPGPINNWLLFLFNTLIRLPDPTKSNEIKRTSCLHYKHQYKHHSVPYNSRYNSSTTIAGSYYNSRMSDSSNPLYIKPEGYGMCYGTTHSPHKTSWWSAGPDWFYNHVDDNGFEVHEIETFESIFPEGAAIVSNDNSQDAVYIIYNGTRHVVPNYETLLAHGLDFNMVSRRDPWEILMVPLGKPLPEAA